MMMMRPQTEQKKAVTYLSNRTYLAAGTPYEPRESGAHQRWEVGTIYICVCAPSPNTHSTERRVLVVQHTAEAEAGSVHKVKLQAAAPAARTRVHTPSIFTEKKYVHPCMWYVS